MTDSSSGHPAHPHPHAQLDAEVQRELEEALGDKSIEQLMDEAAVEAAAPQRDADGSAPKPAHVGHQDDPDSYAPQMVRGRIHAVTGEDVFVEIPGVSGKNQGVVPLIQFERPPRLGSIMDFVVEREDEKEGLLILSREGAVTKTTWDHLVRGSIVEARVTGTNKGGLELELVGGIRAFMPASQIDLHHVGELEPFIGQKLQGSVQEIDRKARKVLLSRRSFLEREKRVKEEKLWKEIEVGQVRDGTVSSVMEYGVFVDIGGADGLVHVSDMSYSRVDKPGDVVKPGEAVKVKVLKLDAEKKRISLGLKQVAPDPWDTAAQQLAVGQQVTGTVRRLADFGAFVEVQPGVDGLLPVSELSWKRIGKPADVVKEGEVLRVVVLQVDPAKHRLTLSLKQAAGDPWVGAEHKYPRHALVAGTVLSTTDFGAFIEIEAGLEGLVHISELADRRVGQVTDVLKIGQQHQFRVLEVDEDNRRIKLSLKAVSAPVEEASQPVTKDAGKVAAPAGKPAAKSRKRSDLKGGMSGNMLGTGLGDLKL